MPVSYIRLILFSLLFVYYSLQYVHATEKPLRVKIIYDSFGKPSNLERGWGYSALIEYGSKRILFDTGGVAKFFKSNSEKLNIHFKSIDFVVISHRHDDHTAGLAYVLKKNPKIKIYTPFELAFFGSNLPPRITSMIERKVEDLPQEYRYFGSKYPKSYRLDSAWAPAHIEQIQGFREVAPGFYLFSTGSFSELPEISLAIKTSDGLVLFVGCSHPGIEKILGEAVKIDSNIHSIFGGLHLFNMEDDDVINFVKNLKEKWKVTYIGAGHCSGEFAQSELEKKFGNHHLYAGLGENIILPVYGDLGDDIISPILKND
jgi:7,8-dihydropterin-6-yl-methyl-4-(beta-D-ribofuranosyl)aminobenzene 5'-phosphate synthase